MVAKRVVVIGLDGLDPVITEKMLEAGALPNLARLRREGGYRRLGTTSPAQTPVAWSSFATGVNPGGHGIFDFLRRDPTGYSPEVSLFGTETASRFLPTRVVNRRGGTALWETLTEAGVPSVVLRHPCTFPPTRRLRGRMLAGVGVPDVRGSFGTPTVYTAAGGEAGESEAVVEIQADGGAVRTYLEGPRSGEDRLRVDLVLRFDAVAGRVVIESEGTPSWLEVGEGEWSDWVTVKFRAGLLQAIRGRVRFHLVSAGDPPVLYASPVNFDPEVPQHRISEPWSYAGELDRVLGGYHTLGMAEDHTGLTNGRLSEEAFLAQCSAVRGERLAMLHYELDRHDRGLFYCLFDTPDRVQHMFWRYREDGHPANRRYPRDPALADTIEEEYRLCDDAVGQAMEYGGPDTLSLVVSDHGFTSFQRQLHLNRWLHENGYLALREGADLREVAGEMGAMAGGDPLAAVDWSRTRAYALGLVGIYLNLEGREGQGTVSAAEAPGLAAEIAAELTGLADTDRDLEAVRRVQTRDAVYSGAFVEDAPDLVVQCAPGYRISSSTAMGGVPERVFSDNAKRWSGDHVVDPTAVPGVLFSSRPIRSRNPRIIDLAPTILRALGAPVPEAMEGEVILT